MRTNQEQRPQYRLVDGKWYDRIGRTVCIDKVAGREHYDDRCHCNGCNISRARARLAQ